MANDFAPSSELNAAYQLGSTPAAVKAWKSLTRFSDPRVFQAFAYVLQDLAHHAEAVIQLRRALELKPAYCVPDIRVSLGNSLWECGEHRAAIIEWRAVVAMEPEYPSRKAPIEEAARRLAQHA